MSEINQKIADHKAEFSWGVCAYLNEALYYMNKANKCNGVNQTKEIIAMKRKNIDLMEQYQIDAINLAVFEKEKSFKLFEDSFFNGKPSPKDVAYINNLVKKWNGFLKPFGVHVKELEELMGEQK